VACLTKIDDATISNETLTISSLTHLPVLRDLIPDLSGFFEQHKFVRPWLELTPEQRQSPHEIRQSIDQRRRLDGLYECILCACCSSACPSYWWSEDGEKDFLGPAALLHAYRWVADSRDVMTEERLKHLTEDESSLR
jgi:succinate dehydrogenase/fumarate reductase iron-sulfur protein